MKKALLLATGWQPDYWETSKEAPYPKTSYTDLPEWDEVSKDCPLPGIGRYIKQKDKDFSPRPFIYLKIKGMRYDSFTGQPFFDFETLQKSRRESSKFDIMLPAKNKRLFSVIEGEELVTILDNIGEDPPEEWKELANVKRELSDWKELVGRYFLELSERSLSNDEFEDRVARLFTALGFDTDQKGHKISGEYPDGVASFDADYGILYDCKNTENFYPSAADERAIKKYLQDEKKVRSENTLHCAFVAKSFKGESKKDIFYFSIDSLLYLLYKKQVVGSRFRLSPLKKILDNFTPLKKETIDKEWIT